MQLQVYEDADGRQAIVKRADDLPRRLEPWSFKKQIDVARGEGPRVGADSDEILDSVEREGVFVLPAQARG